jgi:hypothetical protein
MTMKIKLKALALFAALAMSAAAQAQSTSGSFSCITNNSAASCNQAAAGLAWNFNGSIFSITNNTTGYVSEVYFDVNPGVTAAFAGGTGTLFTLGANPPRLPGGTSVSFTSDLAFDSDPRRGRPINGINQGETASFLFTGAGVQDFASGILDGGVHVRSLIGGQSESLVTVSAVPEPETYAMMLAGLGLMGAVARRRKAKQA